jgi:hypothetical protein
MTTIKLGVKMEGVTCYLPFRGTMTVVVALGVALPVALYWMRHV